MNYRLAIETVRTSHVDRAVIWMHLVHGVKEGATCGTCEHHGEFWLESVRPYCIASRQNSRVDPANTACGHYQAPKR